jgi:hypothetical protein
MRCPELFLNMTGSRIESYTGFIKNYFFLSLLFLYQPINTARGLDNEMRVTEEVG